MAPEISPGQTRATEDADRVLERIVSFYGRNRISDDGESDAMAPNN